MSGRTSQRKGRKAEIELAAILREYGYDVRPGQAVSFGTEPDLVGLPGVHIESKRHETADLTSWLKQAEKDAEYFGGLPAVFWRHNRGRWTVTMDLEYWMTLYKTRFGPQKAPENNRKEVPG